MRGKLLEKSFSVRNDANCGESKDVVSCRYALLLLPMNDRKRIAKSQGGPRASGGREITREVVQEIT